MRRISLSLFANLALLAAVTAPFAGAQVSSSGLNHSGLNQWTLAAAMNTARAQACSAILQDGSVLVAGGVGSSGPVNTAEIYGTAGTFTVTSPMSQARAGAACATLLDGTVLVMGGDDGTGALSTAEIFNPVTQTWKSTGSLNLAREGHQAVVNGWGAVWVAGGTNASGIVDALEEFDPPKGAFRTVGTLTTPRTEFAMALLPGLKVMIAGGTNGSATLGTVEIYNGVLGTVSVAGLMAQVRQDFAAAALPDGTVLLTGGRDANGNLLGSTEIFDPVQGVSTAGPNLATPRAYHSAYGLTNNGEVLITGGAGSSGILASTETYAPWTGAIQSSAPMNFSRRDNVSATLRPGSLLVAGGRNAAGSLNSSELFQYVTIGTDKPDYAPGTPVNISGGGWQPGEQVSVQIMAVPVDQHHIEFTGSGIADGAGNVTVTGFAVDQSHLGVKFILTATGSQLQAQTTFSDGLTPTIAFSFSPPSGTLTAGGVPVTVTVTLTGTGPTPTGIFVPCLNSACNQPNATTATGSCTANGQQYTLPSSGPATCQFIIPSIPAGNTIVAIEYGGDANYSLETPANDPNDGVTYSVVSPTTTTMTSGPGAGSSYGTTTPYIATVTAAVGNTPSGQVQFLVNGVAYGSPVSLVAVTPQTNPPTFTASFVPSPPLAVSPPTYLVTANFLGDSADGASTSGNSISTTIVAATTTTTVSLSANPIVYGQPLTLSGTVTATGGGIPTGSVTITGITGCTPGSLTATGTFSCTVTPPGPSTPGSPGITATYNGTGGYLTSTGYPGNLTVNPANTATSTPIVASSTPGSNNFTFQAQATTVAPSAPSTTPVNAGSITFYSLPGAGNVAACNTGTSLGAVTVNGSGSATTGSVNLPSATYTICAVYSGSTNFNTSTSTGLTPLTSPPSAPVADTVSAPMVTGGLPNFGSSVTISAIVTASTGTNPPTPGTLAFFNCGTSPCVSGGVQIGTTQSIPTATTSTTATYSISLATLSGGNHYLYATYISANQAFVSPTSSTTSGLITINPVAAPFTVSSGPPNPVTAFGTVLVGTSVTLIATYTGGLSPAPSGSVNFVNTSDGNFIVCTGTLNLAGVATCNAVAGSGANLPAGTENISITYVGDTNYTLGAVNPFSFTVAKASTNTLLVPTPNPATVGNTVTLVATVTVTRPSIIPTGTVTFTLGGNAPLANTCISGINYATNVGPPVTYTATCTFELTGPGGVSPAGVPITYSATYNGDNNTLGSTGSTSLTSIGAPTTASLVASVGGTAVASETVGNIVTLTATVNGIIAGIPATGSFTFTQLSGNAPLNTTCLGTGVPVPVSLVGGSYQASCSYEFAGPGATTITYKAVYGPDPNYLAPSNNTTNTDTLTTVAATVTTSLTATGSTTATSETVGNTVTLTATLNGFAGIPPNGSYTFTQSSGTTPLMQIPAGCMSAAGSIPVPVNAAGVATCTFLFAGPGSSAITYSAVYSITDPNYKTNGNTLPMATILAPTMTTLTDAGGTRGVQTETVGNTIILTATLAPMAPTPAGLFSAIAPVGSFTFSQTGGVTQHQTPTGCIGTPVPVNTAGVATCTFEFLGPGGPAITYTAVYGSDPNYAASNKTDTLATFAAATTSTLTDAGGTNGVQTETVGNTIILTATLAPTQPGLFSADAPTGSFTFSQGSGSTPKNQSPAGCIGTPVPVNAAGVATCQFLFAGPGSSTITYTAVYGSDPNYAASASPGTDTLTTFKAPTTSALADAGGTGGTGVHVETVGDTVTLTATLTPAQAGLFSVIALGGSFTFTQSVNGTTPLSQIPNPCIGTPVPVSATGVATCKFEFAGPGASSITYTAAYGSDPNYANSTSLGDTLTTFAFAPTATLVASLTSGGPAVSSETVGSIVYLTVSFPPLAGIVPTGSFTFTQSGGSPPLNTTCLQGAAVHGSLVGGNYQATCSYEFAGPGSSSITYTATYGGDPDYQAAPTKTLSTVLATAIPTLTTSPLTTIVIGNNVTVTATVAGPSAPGIPRTGSVTFTLPTSGVTNSTCQSGTPTPIVNTATGVVTCSFEAFPPTATLPISFTYSGDPDFAAITTPIAGTFTTIATTKATLAVSFTVSPPAPTPGQLLTLTVTVTPPAQTGSTPLPAPTAVTIAGTNNSVSFPSVALVNNGNGTYVATVMTTTASSPSALPVLFAGTYNFTATYNTDASYNTQTASLSIVVGKTNSQTMIASSANTVVVTVTECGPPVSSAACGPAAPGYPTPTGTITIDNAGGAQVATGALNNGTFSALLPSGSYVAFYSGDSNFNASNSGSASQVNPVSATSTTSVTSSANPVPANQPVVLTALISGSGGNGSSPSGTVSFTSNGILLGVAVVTGGGGASGVAMITTTLTGGADTIVATYSGDSVYSGSSGTIQVTVNRPPSTITFSSNLSVAVFGQSVTLSVRVTGSTQGGVAAPTGTVQFFDNGALIGTATVVNGVATLMLALPVGVNTFTVVYSGDANYGSFSGNGGSVTVNMAQILATLTANTNNGQETLTATLAVVAPGSGTPTGTVQFIDTVTGQAVGMATVAGGTASITIPVTTDPIMAVYSGDGNFSASTSTNVSAIAVVNAASYSINFAPDEIVTVFGSSLATQTMTATLPLQTTLGGISVVVTDSAGTARPALLFYVSALQITFMIPDGTAAGTATLTVTTASAAFTATIAVTNSAPGLFTANQNGTGPLAAQVVSVAPGGAQTFTSTVTLNGQTFVNAPISLTPAGNTFFLILYGTGVRFGSVITVTINGTTFTPAFAGAQGAFVGLDQINVLLPANLAGTGTVNVTVTVDGQVSNVGTLAFQ